MASKKLWGATFSKEPTKAVIEFTAGRDVASIPPADYKLLPYDIWGNKAHGVMLYKQQIIDKDSIVAILKGLQEIENLTEDDKFILDPTKEDVHTNIESFLTEKYGIGKAGKLHTARSRNDQSNLDTRLYLRDEVLNFSHQCISLSDTFLVLAEKYKELPIPGFTHHQHAMITTFGHLMLTFASMLTRDAKRFTSWFNLHNTNPLGAAASYGTSFPIDQELTTKFLGFDEIDPSSLDEITNRWEAEADLAFAISIMMNHLSSISQTLILFTTPEFGMIKLDDSFSTGSSIMPQKKNPDPLEVIKGKASLASGLLSGLLGMGKANFIGYNRDSQWSKYIIIDLITECLPGPKVMEGVITTLKINEQQMLAWSKKGFVGATSLLEKMASVYKLPFRVAKVVIEKAVKYSNGEETVTPTALKQALTEENISIAITDKQVQDWQDPLVILSYTKSIGGPGKESIEKSYKVLTTENQTVLKFLKEKQNQKEKAIELLDKEVEKIINSK